MSRIGKLKILIPENVEVNFNKLDYVISVKGSKGILYQKINSCIEVIIDKDKILLSRSKEDKYIKSLHGLYRSLIYNMVYGVTEGYIIKQELIGIGYRAEIINKLLYLYLGYSHNIIFKLPDEVQASVIDKKGFPVTIILKSIDKYLIGQVASKIRHLRKPEPYKGKGIKFSNEIIYKKAIKSSTKK
ncbi:MAG: 50S ribosomal protein L6 [Bacteroides sp.]|nr:MAG: 50S ribosomal protein L6 [Bacteroides sp.]